MGPPAISQATDPAILYAGRKHAVWHHYHVVIIGIWMSISMAYLVAFRAPWNVFQPHLRAIFLVGCLIAPPSFGRFGCYA